MLERLHRDGHGRVTRWEPSDEQRLTAPALLLPDVEFCLRPAWTEGVVTMHPKGDASVVEIQSGGTWFHPGEATSKLYVEPVQPAPTPALQVQNLEEVSVWHDAAGWASRPDQATAVAEARRQATPGRLLWAPGIGTPADYALWVYLGIDLFDASPLLMAAARGTALTTDGPLDNVTAAKLVGDDGPWGTDRLVQHNLETAHRELLRTRHAVETGALRALVERRIYNDPDAVALLRRMDRQHEYLAAASPRHRKEPLACMGWDALWEPSVEWFRRMVRQQYQPPATPDILVILPCSAKKPYKTSKSHRFLQRALHASGARFQCHEVMVTSPLGIVPRELEELYPAAHYDVPVTGHWNRDEEAIIRRQLASLLEKRSYDHVVAHVDASTYSVVRDLLPDAIHTVRGGAPQSIANCDTLRDTVAGLAGGNDSATLSKQRRLQDMQALASFQFGPEAADALVQDAAVRGRAPFLKLIGTEGQRGMCTDERGFLSLTMEGARIIAQSGVKRVWIEDFWPKQTSSLFAVGVKGADPDVREGDDVIVLCGDQLRACGQAKMGADEMEHMSRGVAVQLRHVGRDVAADKTIQQRGPQDQPTSDAASIPRSEERTVSEVRS